MTNAKASSSPPTNQWVRIPDGRECVIALKPIEGVIDGLTVIVSGTGRNPDGKTQYRVKVDGSTRMLVSEEHLDILLNKERLVLMGRESELYRRWTTDRLRSVFAEDRFVESGPAVQTSLRKKT